MESLNVSYLQLDLYWENSQANLDQIEEHLTGIESVVDLVVLPEMFNTGFSMSSSKLAQSMDGVLVKAISKWAKQYGSAIIGSFICQEYGKYFNRLLFVHPDGKIEKYDKRHLFRMANEADYFSPGTERLIVNYKGWRIMPLVCYDLRFPVWSRNQFKLDVEGHCQSEYDLLIYVANWPKARVGAWDKLLLARAIENQAYVMGVNRTGFDGNHIAYNGHSTVINPKGEYLNEPFESMGIQTALLRKDSLEEFSAKFPVGRDADRFEFL